MAWVVLGVLYLLPLRFLASAAAALATSVSPSSALARGGGFGFLGGVALGGLAAAVERVWRRFRAGHDDGTPQTGANGAG